MIKNYFQTEPWEKPSRKRNLFLLKLSFILLGFTLAFLPAHSQNAIRGTVKSAGESLPGVSVTVKGKPIGSVTDINGNYSIANVSQDDILVFTFIGYVTQEIPVKGKSVIDVELSSDTKSLNEVVVVGYGNQKKVNLTGAVDQIGSEYFENKPVPNVGRALQGVVPNLNITSQAADQPKVRTGMCGD